MSTVLDVGCGVFWSMTYVVAIILGFRNQTWCIPTVSICMNFSWELLVVINRLLNGTAFTTAFWIQFAWCLLDLGIIFTWQLFRAREDRSRVKSLLLFVGVLLTVYLWTCVGGGWKSSVFSINLIMSTEFIVRFGRDDSNWTSRFIAVAKLLGTLLATLLNGLLNWNPLVLWLGGLCLLLDSYYLALLIKKGKGKLYEVSQV